MTEQQEMLIPVMTTRSFKGYKKDYSFHYLMACNVCESTFIYNTDTRRCIGYSTNIKCLNCGQFVYPQVELP